MVAYRELTVRLSRLKEIGSARRTLPPLGNGSGRVTFICFIKSGSGDVPYVEPLDADTLEGARVQTRRLLRQHSSVRMARIYLDATEVEILPSEDGSC